MKPRMPLSKSATASHVISIPPSPLGEAFTLKGAGGGVVSLDGPVFTYSAHAFATASFGNQTASLGSPWNSAAGRGSSPIKGANHALLMSTGLRVWSVASFSGNRIARQASRNGMAR